MFSLGRLNITLQMAILSPEPCYCARNNKATQTVSAEPIKEKRTESKGTKNKHKLPVAGIHTVVHTLSHGIYSHHHTLLTERSNICEHVYTARNNALPFAILSCAIYVCELGAALKGEKKRNCCLRKLFRRVYADLGAPRATRATKRKKSKAPVAARSASRRER